MNQEKLNTLLALEAKGALPPEQSEALAGLREKGVISQPQDASFGARFVRGLRDIPDAGAQLVTRGLEAGAEAVAPESDFAAWITNERKNVESINAEAEREYQQEWRRGNTSFDGGRLAGNIVGALPVAASTPGVMAAGTGVRIVGNAAAGAVTGALQPVYGGDFWDKKRDQSFFGAVGGGGVSAAARVAQPAVSAAANKLANVGVSMTPGQIMGGLAKRAEEKLVSVPVLGDAIKAAYDRGYDSFNRAVAARVLSPVGEAVPDNIPTGRELVKYVGDRLSARYDAILQNRNIGVDREFGEHVNQIAEMMRESVIDPKIVKRFTQLVDSGVVKRFINGQMSGETWKAVESRLTSLGKKFRADGSSDVRDLGDALMEVNAAMRGLLQRNAGDAADEVNKLNLAWAKNTIFERAASLAGAKGGVVTPAGFRAAVKTNNQSVRKRGFARGTALEQDFAETAEGVLAPEIGNSFTTDRALMGLGLLGATAVEPTTAAAVAGASAAYTPPMQKILAALLMQRPRGAQAVSRGLDLLAPAVGAPAAALSP